MPMMKKSSSSSSSTSFMQQWKQGAFLQKKDHFLEGGSAGQVAAELGSTGVVETKMKALLDA